MRRRTMGTRVVAGAFCAAMLLAACGGDDGGGGANKEAAVKAMMEQGGLSEDAATCVIDAMADAGVSLDDLERYAAVADPENADIDPKIIEASMAAFTKCADKLMENLDLGDISVPDTEG